jgi:hypothetical protein
MGKQVSEPFTTICAFAKKMIRNNNPNPIARDFKFLNIFIKNKLNF